VVWDRWQYLKDLNSAGQREELYELIVDPLAKKNLAGDHPVIETIRRQLQQLLVVGSQPSRPHVMRPAFQAPAAH
jgi:hypothetical protein